MAKKRRSSGRKRLNQVKNLSKTKETKNPLIANAIVDTQKLPRSLQLINQALERNVKNQGRKQKAKSNPNNPKNNDVMKLRQEPGENFYQFKNRLYQKSEDLQPTMRAESKSALKRRERNKQKREKARLKKQERRERNEEKRRQREENIDKIEFGEVVHAPPDLREYDKHFKKHVVSIEDMEERDEVIALYRAMKGKYKST
ncbi:hypothetical protein PCE1_001164 [Barthelona sp. PCE]